MGIRFGHLSLSVVLMLLTSGCASAGGSTSQMRNTIYATHRIVQNLEQSMSGSVERLNDTTAQLVARMNATDQQTRNLLSVAQENQMKLEYLQRSLDSLTASLYKHLNLSPPPGALLPPIRTPSGVDRGGVTIEPPNTSFTTPTTSAPTPAAQDEDAHYRQAQQYYASEEYTLALQKFDEHLVRFPSSKHSSNAMYWKAHCSFKMGQYESAIAGFEALRNQFPSSNKVPTAMHNQAVSYSRLGQNTRAADLFMLLIREFPDDVATEGAREKLRQLQSLN